MVSNAEELTADRTLTSLDHGKDGQYDDQLGPQVSLDVAGVPKPDEADSMMMTQLDTAGQTQIEDFLDVEGLDSDIGHTEAPTQVEPKSNTRLEYTPDTIMKHQDPLSNGGIFASNLETRTTDLCEYNRDHDIMDIEEDSDLRVKTEESEAPFVWTDMGGDNIDLSDPEKTEVHEPSLKHTPSVQRIINNHSSGTSSSARVHGSGNVTGAGGFFRGFRGHAPRFTEQTEIEDDDSDVSNKGAR